MIDREKVLAVLGKRFAGAPPDKLTAAANAIVQKGHQSAERLKKSIAPFGPMIEWSVCVRPN
jgi:hypothetical protein